jgi:hypothetical protein
MPRNEPGSIGLLRAFIDRVEVAGDTIAPPVAAALIAAAEALIADLA